MSATLDHRGPEPSFVQLKPTSGRIDLLGGRIWFALGLSTLTIATCILCGWAPLSVSVVAVFLFAGPHNWCEARYFLARMPPRWGHLSNYFRLAIFGVVLLSLSFILLPVSLRNGWLPCSATTAVGIWNSLLILWLMTLANIRSRQTPRRAALDFALPAGFFLLAVNWWSPAAWSLGLVYLHPLIAFAFFDREIGRHRPQWRSAYRCSLLIIPLLLLGLWWRLGNAPNLPGNDAVTLQVTRQAGDGIVTGLSTQFLVAAHTFLELLHYMVWVVAIPCVVKRARPWGVSGIPLSHRRGWWRAGVLTLISVGVLIVVALWGAFLVDYPLTRDVYFTIALAHVLAEFPILLRVL